MFQSVLLSVCLFCYSLIAWSYTQTLVFTEQELQQRLNQITPIQKQTVYANIVLTDAQLQLLESDNQLEVSAFIDAAVLGSLHGTGQVVVQGSLLYKNQQGAFYLNQAKVTKLVIDQMNPEVVKQLQPLVQDILVQHLSNQPIYTLDDQDMRQALLKSTLKNIEISNRQVKVSLGL